MKALILDIDGTLVRAGSRPQVATWEARLGLAPGQLTHEAFTMPAAQRARLGLAGDADVWLELACLYRLHAREMRALARDFHASERIVLSVARLLCDLRAERPVALVANGWPGLRAHLTAQIDPTKLAHVLVVSAEEGLAMPDTRFYEAVAERLGVLPRDALFVSACADHRAGANESGISVCAPRLTRRGVDEAKE